MQIFYQKTFFRISITTHYIDDLNKIDLKRETTIIINNKIIK